MIGRVRESRNPKKVIRVTLMESYGEIGRVPVNLLCIHSSYTRPIIRNQVKYARPRISHFARSTSIP